MQGDETRHRGDSNPCGQSPMDFESISLAARTHCLDLDWTRKFTHYGSVGSEHYEMEDHRMSRYIRKVFLQVK